MSEPWVSQWFERYIATRKRNCKWCHGDKRIFVTMGIDAGIKPYWKSCPRCKGTGDEPDFGTQRITPVEIPA